MDPYEVLGVSRTAPDSVIKAAFRARIRETHPDAGGDPTDAQSVNDAYATLSDPARRAQVPPLAPEPAAKVPAEPQTRTEAPSASAASAPMQEQPHLIYTHDRDRRPLWKRRAAWIPVAFAIVIGAGTGGPFGALAALAASAVLLLRWSPKVIVAAYLVAASPLLLALGTGSTPTLTGLIPGAIAVGALTPVLMGWAVILRNIRRVDEAHAVDIFISTRDRFGLDEAIVLDVFTGTAGQHLSRLASTDGYDLGTYVLAPSSFPIDVGDHVLLHGGQPLYAVSSRSLR